MILCSPVATIFDFCQILVQNGRMILWAEVRNNEDRYNVMSIDHMILQCAKFKLMELPQKKVDLLIGV